MCVCVCELGSDPFWESDRRFKFKLRVVPSAYPQLNLSPLTRCNSVFTGNTTPTSAFVCRSSTNTTTSHPLPPPPYFSFTSPPSTSSPSSAFTWADARTSLVSHEIHLHVAAVEWAIITLGLELIYFLSHRRVSHQGPGESSRVCTAPGV